MKQKVVLMVAFGILLVAANGAWAGEDIIEKAMEACKPEIEAYCSQVTPGEGRLLACFYAHEGKLSGRCGYALYDAAAELEQFVAALAHLARECQDDLLEYCGQTEIGEGRVGTCLLEHKKEVTEACSKAIDGIGLEVVDE
jgi:hypothetical protein